MRDLPELLFHELDLRRVLEGNLLNAQKYVDGMSEKEFLNADDQNIVEHVFSKFQVLPIELHEDAKEMDPQETKLDVRRDWNRAISDRNSPTMVPGVKVVLTIPFSGDPTLWKCQPSSYTLNPPRANIIEDRRNDEAGHIEIILESASDAIDEGRFKQEIDSTISNIKGYLGTIRGDVDSHNQNLRPHIEKYVAARRLRLGKHSGLAHALNIPLKKKHGAPDLSTLPIKQRIVKPLPPVPNRKSEKGIEDRWFEYILDVIRHEGCTYETTPQTCALHEEEGLRNIILAHLNGHLQGEATGETFRKFGKTDIRIEDQNRAAFVGECKVWRGPKELAKAVNQLLGYLTWRDCKAALIIFNKEVAGFSAIQKKVPEVLGGHSNCIRPETTSQAGEWRFRFRSAEDEEREIIIHVLLFNLYVAKNNDSDRGK